MERDTQRESPPQPSTVAWCRRPCERSRPGPVPSSGCAAPSWTAGGAAGCGSQTALPGSTSSHTAPPCWPYWRKRNRQHFPGSFNVTIWMENEHKNIENKLQQCLFDGPFLTECVPSFCCLSDKRRTFHRHHFGLWLLADHAILFYTLYISQI